jgi:propanol-preferring alcohol dehydrogenase
MRAMVLHQQGRLDAGPRLVESQGLDPQPGPGELLVEVAACAVCRTDLQLVEGDLPARRLPIVPGHQVVGRVAALGPLLPPAAPQVGARVGVAWTGGACGTCRFCAAGRENLCDDLVFTGWTRDGGYATAMTARAEWVHPLPEGFADLDAAPLLCGGAIGYRSLRVAGVLGETQPAGMRLGLYGFGASATLAIQLAVHAGVEVAVATRSADERAAAEALGATWTGGYDDRPPHPLDAAITFAPSGDVVVAALRAVDRGGVVAINAIHLDRVPQFDYDLLWMERQLRSVANVTRADVREFLAMAAGIGIRTRTEVLPLAAADEALLRVRDGRVAGAAVLATD